MFKSSNTTSRNQFEEESSNKNGITPQVSIYNEDDLSHLLFVEYRKAADHNNTHVVINAIDGESLTPPETFSGAHTPLTEDDSESAILSDLEMDSDLEVPPSPSRLRGGTMSTGADDFEFPIFLGRQQDSESASPALAPVRPAPRPMSPMSLLETKTSKHVRIQAPQHRADEITGPMMSWWPEPIEGMEYAWVERPNPAVVPPEQHVVDVSGPMMSWWPAPMDGLEYEWNDKFYE